MATRFEYVRVYRFAPGPTSESEPETAAFLPDGSERQYDNALAALNDLGREGWELVTATQFVADNSSTTQLYLKRELE
jgi:hypothetical protein